MEQSEYKILIVDDGLFSREMLRRMLLSEHTIMNEIRKPDYEIITAENGLEALEKAANEKPDLILLDIVLPGMSGFEVLAELKESEATKPIPVVIITGLDSIEDEEKGLSRGAVDYISKPFHESLVKARIRIHLKTVEHLRIIEQLSLIDHLTNIPNRRAFDKQMEIEWKRGIREKIPLSILIIDIDHFKKFNDTYGHQQGDEVLKAVAGLIKSEAKRPTDLAVRWGGEEFMVLLPGTNLVNAIEIAEKIRGKIEKAKILSIDGDFQLNVAVSIGVASKTPSVEDKIEDFIEQADTALYAAKESGRNRVCSQ